MSLYQKLNEDVRRRKMNLLNVLISFTILFSTCAARTIEQSDTTPIHAQLNTFNATNRSPLYKDAKSIIAGSGLSPNHSREVQIAVDFERSNWAGYSVFEDPFYKLPKNVSGKAPGSIIKVEEMVDPTLFTLPPSVSLSRIIYQTETMQGKPVPASAFILWPYMPRQFSNISGLPVVTWAHGTSGLAAECAPSHIRNLWYQFSAPFTLALQGYVVVATDFAGLGISHTENGDFIPHQWGSSPDQANDVLFAVKAAQKAFPSLSKQFVVMGHASGGAAAWYAAQRLAKDPMSGCLGTVAVSPITSLRYLVTIPREVLPLILSLVAPTVARTIKGFKVSDWLTPYGMKQLNLYKRLGGCQSAGSALFTEARAIRKDWTKHSKPLKDFDKKTGVGGRDVKGPMLVMQGSQDPDALPENTEAALNATCTKFSNRKIDYHLLKGVTHVPALFAGQQVWLDWIHDRFSGKSAGKKGCERKTNEPPRSVHSYQPELGYFLEYPLYGYETA